MASSAKLRHQAPRCQTPQHQWHQQKFVLANQNGKLKTNKIIALFEEATEDGG
jgi:hypothetical protein